MGETEFAHLVEDYSSGNRCYSCHHLITAIGCPCSRARAYQANQAEIQYWLESLPKSVRDPQSLAELKRAGIRVSSVVRSTATRERRRAGFTDMPLASAGPGDTRTVADDERLALYDQLGITPKWFKPTTLRTKRADNEPI